VQGRIPQVPDASKTFDKIELRIYSSHQIIGQERFTIGTELMKYSPAISISTLLGVLLPLACSSVAFAQDTGFYVKADMGGGVTMDTDLKSFFGPVSSGSEVKFDAGFRFGVAAGYQFTDWFALEAEVGSMSTEISDMTGATYLDAWFSNVPFLANARFQYRNASPFTPYVGAGVGGAASIIDMDYIELNGIGTSGTSSDVEFAWQAFAGLEYKLNEQMSLAIEYHYVWTDAPSWESDFYYGNHNDSISFGQIESHSLSLAFRFRF
jgi:OmpA-OmpF porin, OOP family